MPPLTNRTSDGKAAEVDVDALGWRAISIEADAISMEN